MPTELQDGVREGAGRRLAAAAVHVYTAMGSVLGFLIVLAAIEGDVQAALWWGLLAMFIDGTDGMLARAADVKQQIPWFDGALLDNIVDYLTYVFAPVVLLHTAGYLPGGTLGLLVASAPLLSSCVQFCRSDAKTEDHFFLGFPSYWNVVAFYAIVFDASPSSTAVVVLVCTVLVFVPVRYLYPSRSLVLRTPTMILTAAFFVVYAVIISDLPDPSAALVWLSLVYVAYYAAASVWITVRPPQALRHPVPGTTAA